MKKICIIPARMGSARFYGKPLKQALNIPLVVHVAKRCLLSDKLDAVFVATCDQEIQDVCSKYNLTTIMTSHQHERCTDRVNEAISKCGISLKKNDFILMVQGDEILVTPDMIDSIITEYLKNESKVINLISRIKLSTDIEDPNVVKVVFSSNNYALYFSRSPIPSTYRGNDASIYQQTGVIGFSTEFLKKFSELPHTLLEKVESIDMLRILENGLFIKVVKTEKETVAVDMPYDLERAEKILQQDILVKNYA